MKNNALRIEKDIWLSGVFKYPAYIIHVRNFDLISLDKSLNELAHNYGVLDRTFLTAKIPTEQIKALQLFINAGFSVIDVNLTFGWEALPGPSVSQNPILIRESLKSDRAKVLAIASSSFLYSRFHLDPKIPTAVARKIKKLWVDNYFSGNRGEKLLVAQKGKDVVGFLAVASQKKEGIVNYFIDLIGVGKNSQRMGYGEQLVQYFIEEGTRNHWLMRVGTQAANIPSIRLYEKCGFRLSNSKYVLHAHFGRPAKHL